MVNDGIYWGRVKGENPVSRELEPWIIIKIVDNDIWFFGTSYKSKLKGTWELYPFTGVPPEKDFHPPSIGGESTESTPELENCYYGDKDNPHPADPKYKEKIKEPICEYHAKEIYREYTILKTEVKKI